MSQVADAPRIVRGRVPHTWDDAAHGWVWCRWIVLAGLVLVLVAAPFVSDATTTAGTRGTDVHLWGSLLPGWLAWCFIALIVGLLATLFLGPQPWWAERWAWWWLLALAVKAPESLLLVAIISGPTPLVPRRRDGSWRLAGWQAFVIVLLVQITIVVVR